MQLKKYERASSQFDTAPLIRFGLRKPMWLRRSGSIEHSLETGPVWRRRGGSSAARTLYIVLTIREGRLADWHDEDRRRTMRPVRKYEWIIAVLERVAHNRPHQIR